MDNVTHPSHYTQGKVECIDAIEAAVTGLSGMVAVCTAQCIKYLWHPCVVGGGYHLYRPCTGGRDCFFRRGYYGMMEG